jgi:hypothetical protein
MRPNALFTELHSSVRFLPLLDSFFTDFGAQVATKGVTPPWFKVRPPHSLLLTGFPAEAKRMEFSKLYIEATVSIPFLCSETVNRKPG